MRRIAYGRWSRALACAVLALALTPVVDATTPTPAHAANKVYTEVVHNIPQGTNVPGDCHHIPGITRGGKVWVDVYYDPPTGRYGRFRMNLYTQYRKATATAKVVYTEIYGAAAATCQNLIQWDNYGEIPTLHALACNPWSPKKNSRFCQVANYSQAAGHGMDTPSLDMNLDRCRSPKFNKSVWGPLGYASWHNVGVKIERRDVWQEIDWLNWMPGHLNIDIFLDDIDVLSGVSNIDPGALQPWPGDNRWIGYGKVQDWAVSEWNVAIYDAIAWKIGENPSANPRAAHRAVQAAINNNRNVPGYGNLGPFMDNWTQAVCNRQPWVAATLDPAVGNLPCNTWPIRHLWSDFANGTSIGEMVAGRNNGVVPAGLKGLNAIGPPAIMREAWANTGHVVVNEPGPGGTCQQVIDLGVGRDQHIRRLANKLGTLFG